MPQHGPQNFTYCRTSLMRHLKRGTIKQICGYLGLEITLLCDKNISHGDYVWDYRIVCICQKSSNPTFT